jgi:hypothetical protein
MISRSQRPATLTTCRTCHHPILTGTDDYALTTIADPIPLTRNGEILAALTGRTCWRLDHEKRLWRTDQWRILSDTPLPGDHRLTAHHCGHPIPTTWTTPARPTEGTLF